MNERQLAYVVAIVEEGSFTQAAARCRISQPSLSAAVARLERELGVLLFHRIGRQVSPTDACVALLPAARDVIRATDAVRHAVGDVHEALTGHVEIAVQPTVVAAVVDLLAGYRARFPGVAVRVRSPADDAVALLVASGRAELGLGDLVVPRTDLVWHELWTEAYVCVDRADAASATDRCAPAMLATTPLVTAPAGAPTRVVLERWFATAGVSPRVAIEVDHREALVPLVVAGCGAAIVPRSMTAAVTDPALRVRTLDPPVERRIGIVHRRGGLTPAAERLVALAIGDHHAVAAPGPEW